MEKFLTGALEAARFVFTRSARYSNVSIRHNLAENTPATN